MYEKKTYFVGKRSLLLKNTVYNTKEIKEHEVLGRKAVVIWNVESN